MPDFDKEDYLHPQGWFSAFDMEAIYPALKDSTKKDVYLEIGVHKGRSLSFARKFFKGEVYGIDTEDLENKIEGTKFIKGDSVKVEWNKPIKVLFIDGEHRYQRVRDEWDKYEPFVVKGGSIFFHDADSSSEEVEKFAKEVGATFSQNPRCSMAWVKHG